MILSVFLLVFDGKNGLLERGFVCGVKPFEVIISHLILMSFLLLIQVIILMIFTFIIFGVKNNGTVWDAFLLIYLQGFQGK